MADAEPALASAIAACVAEYRVRRVPLAEILTAAASVDRTAASQPGWRARVGVALESLASEGLVQLPATRWDTTTLPALPAYVTRPAAPADDDGDARVVWHAELSWAADADDAGELSRGERRILVAVNRWMPRRRGVVVPMRERSLEIFGDEKVLESWVGGRLFGEARLNFNLLECEACWPPVHQTVLGDGPWLVVENYTTYVSLSRWAAARSWDGRVVWGSGNQVGTRLAALADAEPCPAVVFYFGDVDAGGFRVARGAVRRAEDLGLGVVVPARGLYRIALDAGQRRTVKGARPSLSTAEWAQRWLGPELGVEAAAIVTSGERVVQETVGLELLADATLEAALG